MEKPKRNLKKSVTFAVIFFTVLLTTLLGFIGYRTYYSGMILQYQKYADAVLDLAYSDFNWDKIEECIKNQKEDDTFLELRKRLDFIKSNTKIAWLYIFEPLNANPVDNQRYIFTSFFVHNMKF